MCNDCNYIQILISSAEEWELTIEMLDNPDFMGRAQQPTAWQFDFKFEQC